MKFSTKSEYGLRAMVYLAKAKNKISSLKEIAKKEGISFDYLEKIISKLEKSGLVKAKRGIKGGYFLAKKPEEIKIGEIIESLEGKFNLAKCLYNFCQRSKRCFAKNFWQKLNRAINLTLNSISLADLIKEK